MTTRSTLRKKHLAIAVSAALAGLIASPGSWAACSPVGNTYTVDTTADTVASDGVTSFREAVAAANASAGCDTVNFDNSLSGQTIVIDHAGNSNSEITIADDINIVGLGSDQLTIAQQNGGNAFDALLNACNGDIDLSGLTFDGQNSSSDRAIYFYEGAFGDAPECNTSAGIIGSVVADDIVVKNNVDASGTSGDNGMDLDVTGNVSISNSQFSDNYATGLDIFTEGDVSLTNVSISGNTGGGLRIQTDFTGTPSITISNSTISGNTTANGFESTGAGIRIQPHVPADILISNSTIDGNTAADNGGTTLGGGIYAGFNQSGTFSVVNSTISNNTSEDSGGGIYLVHSGSSADVAVAISQSTISGNEAAFAGGGLFIDANSNTVVFTQRPLIQFSTITNNSVTDATSGEGGGFYANISSGDIDLSHSVIAGNTSANTDPDIGLFEYFGAPAMGNIEASYSFIGTDATFRASSNVGGTSTLNGGDPMLNALADNGGDTLTHLPMDTSPLLEVGDPALLAGSGGTPNTDQRGGSRIQFDFIDIGAVELQAPPPAGSSSSGLGPVLTGLLAAVMGLFRLRRR